MDIIDLDAIIAKEDQEGQLWLNKKEWDIVIGLMKEAIHQALVLASEDASFKKNENGVLWPATIDKQSILDVNKCIKYNNILRKKDSSRRYK